MKRGGVALSVYSVTLDEAADRLYRAVADRADLPVERVLADALFKLAGELALEGLAAKKK